MEKLKVGTKVQIKSNLSPNEPYGHGSISPSMVRYNGLETEVSEVHCNWYALKGAEGCYQPEMFDIIKESKTMEKKSFAIPEGCKVLNVSEESGRLVIEFEEVVKFEPKRGDICTGLLYDYSFCFILDRIEGCRAYYHAANASNEATPRTGKDWCDIVHLQRLANEEETAQLFTALEKEGLKWNAETMEVERLRWKPKDNESYCYLNSYLEPTLARWNNSGIDLGRWSVGNCHKNKETCTVSSTKCKELLLSL